MKTQRRIFWILTFLPLAIDLIALPFLPDRIPAHYGADNQVTRWGSKWETLLFPGISILFGGMMWGIAKSAASGVKGENNRRASILCGTCGLAVFNVLTLYFLCADFLQAENLSQLPVDLYQLTMGFLGLGLIVIGNRMPRLGRNSLVGLRTRWSLQDDETWKKSQRFGGIALVLGGLALLVTCLRLQGFACLAACLGILALVTAVSVAYSRRAARR